MQWKAAEVLGLQSDCISDRATDIKVYYTLNKQHSHIWWRERAATLTHINPHLTKNLTLAIEQKKSLNYPIWEAETS